MPLYLRVDLFPWCPDLFLEARTEVEVISLSNYNYYSYAVHPTIRVPSKIFTNYLLFCKCSFLLKKITSYGPSLNLWLYMCRCTPCMCVDPTIMWPTYMLFLTCSYLNIWISKTVNKPMFQKQECFWAFHVQPTEVNNNNTYGFKVNKQCNKQSYGKI